MALSITELKVGSIIELTDAQAHGMELPPDMPGPECTAPMVAYLASDEAANINGQTFDVFGGKISLIVPPHESKILFHNRKWETSELKDAFPSTLGGNLIQPQFNPSA